MHAQIVAAIIVVIVIVVIVIVIVAAQTPVILIAMIAVVAVVVVIVVAVIVPAQLLLLLLRTLLLTVRAANRLILMIVIVIVLAWIVSDLMKQDRRAIRLKRSLWIADNGVRLCDMIHEDATIAAMTRGITVAVDLIARIACARERIEIAAAVAIAEIATTSTTGAKAKSMIDAEADRKTIVFVATVMINTYATDRAMKRTIGNEAAILVGNVVEVIRANN